MPAAAASSTTMADDVRPEFVDLANWLADAAAEITVPLFRYYTLASAQMERAV